MKAEEDRRASESLHVEQECRSFGSTVANKLLGIKDGLLRNKIQRGILEVFEIEAEALNRVAQIRERQLHIQQQSSTSIEPQYEFYADDSYGF